MNKFFFIIFTLFTMNLHAGEIYVGKSLIWVVYFNPNKSQPIIEIGGVKYGHLDYLVKENETLARSKEGTLYKKGGDLFYRNDSLKIHLKLKKKSYSPEIDAKRYKIFKVNAFNEISKLKDSLNVSNYQFNWQVKGDFEYFKNNDTIPENYIPNYKRIFFESIK